MSANLQRLTRRVARELDDAQNELWLSPVSIWEALLLHRKHRLKIPEGFSTWVTRALTTIAAQRGAADF